MEEVISENDWKLRSNTMRWHLEERVRLAQVELDRFTRHWTGSKSIDGWTHAEREIYEKNGGT